jgi:glycosyltransferase involved in cell wall biosynthesis
MVVLGGIAARFAGVRRLVLAPTGLGHLWTSNGASEAIARNTARIVAGFWLKGAGTRFLFENTDDPREFWLDADKPPVTIVPGAGVDPIEFSPVPEPPAPPLKVAVVARMIAPKGIAEAVAAVRRARELGAAIELHLYGTPDPSNRRSCTESQLREWSAEGGVTWHGRSGDIARVWHESHIAMLLTWYREGVPRSLIEAAASGRPIVTTDSPGCRDLVRDGREGRLVPLHDSEVAARALVELAQDPALRARLGAGARARVLERFTEEKVRGAVRVVYAELSV